MWHFLPNHVNYVEENQFSELGDTCVEITTCDGGTCNAVFAQTEQTSFTNQIYYPGFAVQGNFVSWKLSSKTCC